MANDTAIAVPKITLSRGIVWGFAATLGVVMLTTQQGDILIRVGAISGLAIALFATRLLPEVVTAVGCFLAFIAIAAAPPRHPGRTGFVDAAARSPPRERQRADRLTLRARAARGCSR